MLLRDESHFLGVEAKEPVQCLAEVKQEQWSHIPIFFDSKPSIPARCQQCLPAGKWNHGRHGCNFILGSWALCCGAGMEKKIQFLPLKPGCMRFCSHSWWRDEEHELLSTSSQHQWGFCPPPVCSIWELECCWRFVGVPGGAHLKSGLLKQEKFKILHINHSRYRTLCEELVHKQNEATGKHSSNCNISLIAKLQTIKYGNSSHLPADLFVTGHFKGFLANSTLLKLTGNCSNESIKTHVHLLQTMLV